MKVGAGTRTRTRAGAGAVLLVALQQLPFLWVIHIPQIHVSTRALHLSPLLRPITQGTTLGTVDAWGHSFRWEWPWRSAHICRRRARIRRDGRRRIGWHRAGHRWRVWGRVRGRGHWNGRGNGRIGVVSLGWRRIGHVLSRPFRVPIGFLVMVLHFVISLNEAGHVVAFPR